MPEEFNFPANPVLWQLWTSPVGSVYVWTGVGWVVGAYDSDTQKFGTIDGILDQVRSLLQDTNLAGGQYRYSTDSLIVDLNMALLEMFRIRPDIFLRTDYVVPQFTVNQLGNPVPIEQQFVPPLIFYVVGMAQLRDDEETQDARAVGFLSRFSSMLTTVT